MSTFRNRSALALMGAAALVLAGCGTDPVAAELQPMPVASPEPYAHTVADLDRAEDAVSELINDCRRWCSHNDADQFVAVEWRVIDVGDALYQLEYSENALQRWPVNEGSSEWDRWHLIITTYGDGIFVEVGPVVLISSHAVCSGGTCEPSADDFLRSDGAILLFDVSANEPVQVGVLTGT